MAEEYYSTVVAAFGSELHAAGIPMSADVVARFANSVTMAKPHLWGELYWLGRVTLLTSKDQVPVYDAIFDRYFRNELGVEPEAGEEITDSSELLLPKDTSERDDDTPDIDDAPTGDTIPMATGPSEEEADPQDDEQEAVLRMSETEFLLDKDFGACSPDELALIRQLVERFRLAPPPRRARRFKAKPSGRRLDLRSTLRRAQRTGGDPVELMRRDQPTRPRRVVLIADVSGSMENYSRVYLHVMRGAVRALHAEAFVFATRLTRLTRVLEHRDADSAYRRALEAAPDWAGGTRIGQALDTFLREHGRRGLARGAVVVIVSDGWEIGDPELVRLSMERLARLAHHIIWVNPRKAAPGFAPLVGGMANALPYIDTFVSGHSVRTLEEVLAAISRASERSAPAKREVLVTVVR